jgi:hypothetical protein
MLGFSGGQLDPYRFATRDDPQGYVAPLGVATLLPFTLSRKPVSRASVKCLVGLIVSGQGTLARLGVDFDVDINTRRVTWLATARFALDTTMFTSFFYLADGLL